RPWLDLATRGNWSARSFFWPVRKRAASSPVRTSAWTEDFCRRQFESAFAPACTNGIYGTSALALLRLMRESSQGLLSFQQGRMRVIKAAEERVRSEVGKVLLR